MLRASESPDADPCRLSDCAPQHDGVSRQQGRRHTLRDEGHGAPQLYIGVLVAMYTVFPMLLGLYAGKLTDRLGVRLPMIAPTPPTPCAISAGR